ncbi:hypothetical protein R5R35_009293 [Gryllus longicercus]|uniref:Serpin domain-containing protein n=1 Tax=Gryllus longicercus TaxID=2509291 RepID=A0AAN9WT15_9ORTH
MYSPQILHEDRGNILFSSPNIEMVLGLLYVGARHKTAEEILSGLELPNDINIIKNGYTAISSSLKNMNTTVFEVVNKLYIEKTFPVEKELSLVAEKTFMTSAENVDFLENSEELHEAMNSWIEKETNAKIQKLFSQNDSTPVSRMVLINAVYFKGKWKTPFNVSNTCKEPFYVSSTESLQVDMMHIKETFGYMPLDELNAQMLVMPYVGDKMCMMILLPNEIDGLHEMENKLNCVKISQLLDSAYIQQVDVSLPRFKVEMTIDLQNLLQKIGINSIFDRETADFANISKERGLFVSKALQKAFIEVSEEGSDTPKAARK